MKYRSGTGLYVLAAVLITALLSSAATIVLIKGGVGDSVMLSAGEYAEYCRFMALDEVADKIEEEFYADVPSRDTLVAGAASGMLGTLNDQYARYYTAEEYDEYLSSVNGEYRGIGMVVSQPDEAGAMVLEVYDGSPAQAAGIKAGDILTYIEDASTVGMTLEELSSLIASQSDDGVLLKFFRVNDTFEVTVYSEDISVNHVEYALFNENTGYISISMFSGNCAEEFEAAVDDLKSRNMTSLVIDLRNNPGGSLDAVVSVADELLGKGMRIVSVGPEGSRDEDVYEASGRPIGVPVAVLVNQNSASASEILAAAIQENGVGKVVGTKTFGKGIVQTTMPVESTGGWLKLTTDAYYTPQGNNIHGVGIAPDICAELPEEYQNMAIEQIEQENDAQLWAALKYVRAKAE